MRQPAAREVAVEILTKVEQEQAYSNLLLNQTLQKYKLERVEASFTTELVYGTIQRLNTMDYFLNMFVTKGVRKLQPWVRSLLRLSFYQLYYLDRIPVHAIVNEAVNIAKRKGHRGISGMVNAVLRNVHRSMDKLVIPSNLKPVERISLQHSHPEWLVKRWIEKFGEDTAERMCESNNLAPHVSVRANRMKGSREELLQLLQEQQLEAVPSLLSQEGIIVTSGGNMAHSELYQQGRLSIQDESSMLVAELVEPQPGMRVLDCCAAPGGKAAHIAERMNNTGTIYANDFHLHKRKLIQEQADRLGLTSIETMVSDALELDRLFEPAYFDRILLDAPCSGLGVIRRKPDLKWQKKEREIAQLPALQLQLLTSAAKLLKPEGKLIYSTCTVEPEENEELIAQFLVNHPQFELDPTVQAALPEGLKQREGTPPGMICILPHDFHSDGFFISRLRVKR